MRKPYPSDVRREQFELIREDLENAKKSTRPREIDLYEIFCAILYLLKNGCTWRGLPHDFPDYRHVNYYYKIWTKKNSEGQLHYFSLKTLQVILCDGGYTGEDFANKIRELTEANVQVAKRSELHTFAVIPKRWIVERSFGWLDKCRRLWKNCERLMDNTLNMVTLSFVSILLKRF